MQSLFPGPDDEEPADWDTLAQAQLIQPVCSDSPPFDPEEPVQTTTEVDHGSSHHRRWNQYVKVVLIGKGKHGEVFECTDEIEGSNVAVKVVRKNNTRDKLKLLRRINQENPDGQSALNSTLNSIRKEIALMKKLRHANIVRLVEILDDPRDDKIYLVMENLDGGPIVWSKGGRPILTLPQIRRIMRDTILGLEYLHHEGIIHRDIKPANIIWTSNRHSVKLIDFGVAHYIPPTTSPLSKHGKGKQVELPSDIDPSLFPESDIQKRAGTPAFLAPEIVWVSNDSPDPSPSSVYDTYTGSSGGGGIKQMASPVVYHGRPKEKPKDRPPVTKSIDIWSLGVTFYCLLFGHTPFDASASEHVRRSEFVLYKLICTADWPLDERMGADRVLTGGRPPRELDSDGYSVVQLLEHLLQKKAENRITLAEIKANPWILKDIENPKEWLQLTSPSRDGSKPSSNWVKSAGKRFLRLIPRKG